MNKSITFSQVVEGYWLHAEARHLSPHTLSDYKNTFKKFAAFLAADPPFTSITAKTIEAFLAAQTVSKKTILNYHTGLSALWTWAVGDRLARSNVVHQVEPPKPEKHDIVPFTEADLRAILSALIYSIPYIRPGKVQCRHKLPFADRNRAIILILLDTGIRASELCDIKLHDVDIRNRRITVFGKGDKGRTIPFSAPTGQAIWKYVATRKETRLDEPLIATSANHPMDRVQLRRLLESAGRRAGVQGVYPHRFRHTFAITFLRNGGDPYSLQAILGHAAFETVKIYIRLAQIDLDNSHRRASPVENWRL